MHSKMIRQGRLKSKEQTKKPLQEEVLPAELSRSLVDGPRARPQPESLMGLCPVRMTMYGHASLRRRVGSVKLAKKASCQLGVTTLERKTKVMQE